MLLLATVVHTAGGRAEVLVNDANVNPGLHGGATDGLEDVSNRFCWPDAVSTCRALGEYLPNLFVSDVSAVDIGKSKSCVANPLLQVFTIDRSILASTWKFLPVVQDPPSLVCQRLLLPVKLATRLILSPIDARHKIYEYRRISA
jgi:hypothetical protein